MKKYILLAYITTCLVSLQASKLENTPMETTPVVDEGRKDEYLRYIHRKYTKALRDVTAAFGINPDSLTEMKLNNSIDHQIHDANILQLYTYYFHMNLLLIGHDFKQHSQYKNFSFEHMRYLMEWCTYKYTGLVPNSANQNEWLLQHHRIHKNNITNHKKYLPAPHHNYEEHAVKFSGNNRDYYSFRLRKNPNPNFKAIQNQTHARFYETRPTALMCIKRIFPNSPMILYKEILSYLEPTPCNDFNLGQLDLSKKI